MVEDQDYKGKWALILGGSSGLGLATAIKLGNEGMHLCIVHRTRRSALEKYHTSLAILQAKGIQVLDYNMDALNVQKQSELIQELINKNLKGEFKAIIHSIARGNLKPMYSDSDKILSTTDFELTINAMAVSLYEWVSAFAKAHLFSQDARIIAFTSEGSYRAWEQYGAVGAAKAALESIVRGIALEFAPLKIKANCIQAGVTDTESLRMIPGSEKLKEKAKERNPYKKLTIPEQVANVVYLLCTNEASWINGAVIPVDGGEHLR